MPFTLAAVTCPLCGLGFTNPALLELHLRDDHRRRPRPAGRPAKRDHLVTMTRPAGERATESAPEALPAGPLPRARTVLAVTARPGQESTDLGLLLYAFRRHGACLALLSLTRGEASPRNSTCQRLETIRPWELLTAAGLLGVSSVSVADYQDGGLSNHPITNLTEQVRREIRKQDPDLIMVTDPAEGDADDAAVARAVCRAAEQAGVPVLARMRSAAHGGRLADLGPAAADAHAVRRSAIAAHASQYRARPGGEPAWPRQPSRERLRWLIPPAA